MKISWTQIKQSLFATSLIKLAINIWKNWKVTKGDLGLETLGKNFRNSNSQNRAPAPTSLQDHKVDAWPVPAKPEVQIGVTYSKNSFDMECALAFFPVRHGAETSALIGEIHQICGQGTTLETLFGKLNELKKTAGQFQEEVEVGTDYEAYLVVPYAGAHKVVLDTPKHRRYYRLSDQRAEQQKVILKSDRLLACDKIDVMMKHLMHELGPGKLEEKLNKLETRFRETKHYSKEAFERDLSALNERALGLKAKCAAIATSDDPRISSLAQQWMQDLNQVVRKAHVLMGKELPDG